MKNNKKLIYEFIQRDAINNNKGIETIKIAQATNLLRNNVSAILNELVSEGFLIKTTTRPVLYKLSENENKSILIDDIIGYNYSMKDNIKLVKAALMYPKYRLDMLITSEPGSGLNHFIDNIIQFAKTLDSFSYNFPIITIDCSHYVDEPKLIDGMFYGYQNNLKESCFYKAKGGFLIIENVELLNTKYYMKLLSIIENKSISNNNINEKISFKDTTIIISCDRVNQNKYSSVFSTIIEIPTLKERGLKEKYKFIQTFFMQEAQHFERTIVVPKEVIESLLVFDNIGNIKELYIDIKSGCAKANIRSIDESDELIQLSIYDLNAKYKKTGLLIKSNQAEIKNILNEQKKFYFSVEHEKIMHVDNVNKHSNMNNSSYIYNDSDNVNQHLKTIFDKYQYRLREGDDEYLDKLSKFVDNRIIKYVLEFSKDVTNKLDREISSNEFYGICLHLNSLINNTSQYQRLSDNHVVEFIENNPIEYKLCSNLIERINLEFNIKLPIYEIVLIGFFLVKRNEKKLDGHPILLYVMHGGAGTALMQVTKDLTQTRDVYHYNLELDTPVEVGFEELKSLIIKINNGKGILVIYDMGSIKTMLEIIGEETGIKIRTINIPITMIGIEAARECVKTNDLEMVYHKLSKKMRNLFSENSTNKSVLITLCHTGEGGAIQVKNYIDQYTKLDLKIIPLAISDRKELISELIEIKKNYHIHGFVGTYDPKLFGIPFIDISKIFTTELMYLDKLLMFEPLSARELNYQKIYEYLEEQLKYTSIAKLKTILPKIIDELNVYYNLDDNQKTGLFMHIACLIERLLSGDNTHKNDLKNDIMNKFIQDYNVVTKVLKEIERKFKIIINDEDICTIVMIIKKL